MAWAGDSVDLRNQPHWSGQVDGYARRMPKPIQTAGTALGIRRLRARPRFYENAAERYLATVYCRPITSTLSPSNIRGAFTGAGSRGSRYDGQPDTVQLVPVLKPQGLVAPELGSTWRRRWTHRGGLASVRIVYWWRTWQDVTSERRWCGHWWVREDDQFHPHLAPGQKRWRAPLDRACSIVPGPWFSCRAGSCHA